MAVTARNRLYSSIPSPHSIAAMYAWGDNNTATGANGSYTGGWGALTTDAAGNLNVTVAGGLSLSGATVTIPPSTAVTGGGTFTPNMAIITGSQQVINAGYKAASIGVYSGSAFVNGFGPYLAPMTMNFGGYAGFLAAAPLVIGATGASGTSGCLVYINWET